MGMDLYWRTVASLLLVLGLIVMCSILVRRFGIAGRMVTRGNRRLGIVEVTALDARRRLVLIRRDDVEHLLLLGPTQDTLIESHIGRPPAASGSFATHLTENLS
jgi:flagellar protein FliO/FliZ